MPTISPPRTLRLRRPSGRPAWPDVATPCERPAPRSPLAAGRARPARVISWPHISRAIAARVSRGRSLTCRRRAPWRSTTQRCGERPDLVQLVADEDDAEPSAAMARSAANRPSVSGRRQHRGRLVEDQHAGAAKQRLDDLQPLLLADRAAPRPAGRGRARRPSCALDRARGRRAPPARSSGRACPAGRPAGSRARRAGREVEMLVHHADAGGQRGGRAADARPARRRPGSCRHPAW